MISKLILVFIAVVQLLAGGWAASIAKLLKLNE